MAWRTQVSWRSWWAETVVSSGGAISQWTDGSGNGRHYVQSNASFKPTVGGAGFNGKPWLAFSWAGSQFLSQANASSTVISAAAGYIAVALKVTTFHTSTNSYSDDLAISGTLGGYWGLGLDARKPNNTSGPPGTARAYVWDGAEKNANVSCPVGGVHIVEMWWDSTNVYLRVDGGTIAQTASGAIQNVTGLLEAGKYIDGGIAAIACINSVPTLSDRNAIYASMAAEFQWNIAATAASYVMTGSSATLTVSRKLSCASASFAMTGSAATLTVQRKLSETVGTFAETGNAASLKAQRKLSEATGSFVETGAAAALTVQHKITCASGSFAVAGSGANLAVVMPVSAGALALTGQNASLSVARKLSEDAGSFVETAAAASLTVQHKLTCASGVFSFTGSTASFAVAFQPAPGSFAFTGSNAFLTVQRKIDAAAATFVETGRNATLTYVRVLRLATVTGAFVLTGPAANLLRVYTLHASPGAFSMTAPGAALSRVRRLTALSRAFILDGQDAALSRTDIVSIAWARVTPTIAISASHAPAPFVTKVSEAVVVRIEHSTQRTAA